MKQQNQGSYLEIKRVGEVAVAKFTREVMLSGQEAEAAGDELTALLAGPGPQKLLLDFANVHSLSSLMFAKLIALNRKAESTGGRLALCNLRPLIAEILEVTRLTQILCVYPGEQEALQSF